MSDESVPKFEDTEPLFEDTLPLDEEPKVTEAPSISKLDSAIQGGRQGATAGFSDEGSGLFGAGIDATQALLNKLGLTDKSPSQVNAELAEKGFSGDIGPTDFGETYTQFRDEDRATMNAAQKANPYSFMGGALTGGLATVPLMPAKLAAPLGAAAKSAPVLEKIARGAVNAIPTATLGGVGMSEADLTEGDIGGLGKDALTGLALGAGIGASIPAVSTGVSNTVGAIAKSKPIQELMDAYKAGRQNLNLSSPQFLKESRDKLKEIGGKVEGYIERKTQDLFKQKRQVLNNLQSEGVTADTKDVVRELSDNVFSSSALKDDEVKMLGKTISKMMGQNNQKSPHELENMLRELKDLKANVTTPSGMEAVNNAVKKVQALQDNMSPEISKINNQLFQTIDAGEALLKENVLDYANASKELLGKEKLANLFENSTKYKTESFLDDIINRGLETSKGAKVSPLKELAPDVAELITSTKPIVRNMELAKDAQRPIFSTASDFLSTTARGINKAGTNIANKTGLVVEANKQFLQRGVKALSDASPETLNTIASKMAQVSEQGAQYARVLAESAGKNSQSRNAIIFGLMQQPKFREMFQELNNDNQE